MGIGPGAMDRLGLSPSRAPPSRNACPVAAKAGSSWPPCRSCHTSRQPLAREGSSWHARSPETYVLAYYWYCSRAADLPPAPRFTVPAPWPPEPEEPSGGWEEAEGSATQGPDACGSGAADAEADA